VVVNVNDADGLGVGGVLLSLSGGSYRSNNATNSLGNFAFRGLVQGRYFIRPYLKEYTFNPQSEVRPPPVLESNRQDGRGCGGQVNNC
jgi:hypothetical protein